MKRYAFVDVDNTLVDGNLGVMLGRRLFFRRQGVSFVRLHRLLAYFVKSVHIFALYPFSFLLSVYDYVQDRASDRYLDLVESLPADFVDSVARDVAFSAVVPDPARNFLHTLVDSGYDVVLLSASPSVVLKHLVDRLGLPLSFVGLDRDHPLPFTASVKANIIRSEFSDGYPAIVAGNPRREPFWLARERAIVVKSPYDFADVTI